MTATDIVHILHKGNPLPMTDLLGGQIDMTITDMSTGVPRFKPRKLRAIGVSTAQRSALSPDEEVGVKGYDLGYWFAAYAPAKTPSGFVNRLLDLLFAGIKTPAATILDNSGGNAYSTTPKAWTSSRPKSPRSGAVRSAPQASSRYRRRRSPCMTSSQTAS